jgi:Potential Queuosine, Q, salvage protein family
MPGGYSMAFRNNSIFAAPEYDRLGVLTATFPIIRDSQQISIDSERASTVAASWAATSWPIAPWDTTLHFFDGSERSINWLALLDALNFCFWSTPDQPRWRVRWQGEWYNGYNALAVALKRAVTEADLPLWDASFLANIDAPMLANILRADPDETGRAVIIPLFDKRLANVRELGQILQDRYAGRFIQVIEAVRGDAVLLAQRVAADFPSFNDIVIWQGQTVPFLKRAQILVADIAAAFTGSPLITITHLEELTAFADYKVPQLLRRLGILEYASELAERLDHYDLIEAGSDDEIAIRAATIWGVELLRRALIDQDVSVTASAIDYRLWLAGQSSDSRDRPYHRTRTIFY